MNKKSKNKNLKNKEEAIYRPPIVAMLGHVDHGKTTILDAIRQSSKQEQEAGGITQDITCWSVQTEDSKSITFIDTPGHEAFNLMRSYGGDVADIVILVVAADDGVQPQTRESIEIIQETQTPCIVAINKVDVAGIDIEKVKRELANEDLLVESMGGEVPTVELSGTTGEGIDELLELIDLVAELHNIESVDSREGTLGTAFVLESIKDKSKGNVSTIVVTEGTFEKGKYISYLDENEELQTERIKSLLDENNQRQESVSQGYAARLMGLAELMQLGQVIYCLENKDDADKEIFEIHKEEVEQELEEQEVGSTENLLADMLSKDEEEGDLEELKVVVKAESQGSLKAIEQSLEDVNTEGLIVDVVKSGVGNIHVNDVEYAHNLGAIVIGFSVEVDNAASEYASSHKVLLRTYDIIYNLVEELEDAAISMQAPEKVEEVTGKAEVRQIFTLSDGTDVIGVRVSEGEIKHGLKCKIMRNGDEVGRGSINSMQHGKEKVTTTGTGNECGLIIDSDEKIEEGDMLICYRIVKR